MSIKNKILAGVSTILTVGTIAGVGLNIKLPNDFYDKFDDGSVGSSVGDVISNDFYDPYGDRLYVEREESRNYFQANRLGIENNTIKIALDEDLPQEYVEAATKAAGLYQKLFDIINPNIKVEIGFGEKDEYNIYVIKADESKGLSIMDTSMWKTGSKNHLGRTMLERAQTGSIITIYNIADEMGEKSNVFTFAHEYAHAIFGFNDYNKAYDFSMYGFEDGQEPPTIMNYSDLNAFEKVSDVPKFTIVDVAMAVEQWGLFADHGLGGDNPFDSEEDYLRYVDSRLGEVCYSDDEMMLFDNMWSVYYGKTSLLDYFTMKFAQESGDTSDSSDEPDM